VWPSNQSEISGKIGVDTQNGVLGAEKAWKNHKWAECVLHASACIRCIDLAQ